jgi:hypothetical protein
MKLDLRFINHPVEDLWCQAIVLLVFEHPSILNDIFSNINDKMGGSIGDLIAKGVWTGEKGENLLLATQDTLMTDKLLMRGLGPEGAFEIEALIKEISQTGAALDGMGVREFAVRMPSVHGRESEYGLYLETAASGLAETFYNRHKDEADFLLKIFFLVERDFMNDIRTVMKRLKENLGPRLDLSIISDRQINKGYEEV